MKKPYNVNLYVNEAILERLVRERHIYETKFKHNLQTRYTRAIKTKRTADIAGDRTLQRINELFFKGMGMRWSPVQQTIFRAAVDCALPKIYGKEWNTVKERVLAQRNLPKMKSELLIQMGRRNGKTHVTSGVAAVFMLCIPNIKVAIFSVSERQSKMLMTEIENRIKSAFKAATHVTKDQFAVKEKNKERIIYIMNETGTEQEVGSYPGSVRVSYFFILVTPKKNVGLEPTKRLSHFHTTDPNQTKGVENGVSPLSCERGWRTGCWSHNGSSV